jgi:hypothetical protein
MLSAFFYAVSHFAIVRSAYIAFRQPTQDEVKSKDDDSCKTTLFCGPESEKKQPRPNKYSQGGREK